MWTPSGYLALALSGSTYSILLTALVLALLIFSNRRLFRKDGLPPGPFCLPFVGYYPFLGKWPMETLHRLRKRYGPVYSIKLGGKSCVVIGDIHSMKEAYAKDAFNGRPPDSPFKLNSKIESLIQFDGKPWIQERRFSLTVFRNLGFGKTRMEDVIKSEVSLFLQEYHKSRRSPEVFHQLFCLSTSNVIGVLLLGRQFAYDDPQRTIFDRYLQEISPYHDQTSVHVFFPWLREVIFNLPFLKYRKATVLVKQFCSFARKEIEEHERSVDDNEPRDYIDSYLTESNKPEAIKQVFNKNVLNGNIGLFFRAGSLTTRAVVEWALLASALYPDIQDRVQREIDDVVGSNRQVNWEDHVRMPYTVAVLNETQRWRTIVPINLLRFTTEDTTVAGYRVPAETVVITNLWGIHNDESSWPQPEKFLPERMLDPSGSGVIQSDAFVSFSYGRRACPGKTLANMEMFLYYASILQKHRVCLPDGEPAPSEVDLKGESHVTSHPKNLRIVLKERSFGKDR